MSIPDLGNTELKSGAVPDCTGEGSKDFISFPFMITLSFYPMIRSFQIMCVHVCVHVYVNLLCVHVGVFMCAYMYDMYVSVFMYVHMCGAHNMHMHIFMYVHLCMCIICTYILYVCLYLCVHVCVFVYACVYTCVCVCVCRGGG